MNDPFSLKHGQTGLILFNITANDGANTALTGAVMQSGRPVPLVVTGCEVRVPVLPPGVYLMEVRCGGATVLYNELEVLRSPLGAVEGVTSWTVSADLTQPLPVVSVVLNEGPRGKSAYEHAVAGGYGGTEAEWNAAMSGLTEAETNAATSASNAATSEGNAAKSAEDAEAAKGAAATSASNAATSEGNAAKSAEDAEAAKGAASASESNAATSAETCAALLEETRALRGLSVAYDVNEDGQRHLSDEYINLLFQLVENAYPGTRHKKYGVQWPKWPDLQNSTSGPNVNVGGVNYSQSAPWAQSLITSPETHIRKIGDNAGLVGCFHEAGVTPLDARDDYETIPLFMHWRVNYIRDKHGNPLPVALSTSPQFATTGAVDVGIMTMPCYVKYEDAVETEGYDAEKYATLYNTYGGVPVRRMWMCLEPPAGEEGWSLIPAAVKHDGTPAPYCIRPPYYSGIASDGKYRCQPGLLAINGMSHNALFNALEKPTSSRYKGPGYHGGSMEVAAWGWQLSMLKHGAKSTQKLARGVADWKTLWAAEVRDTEADTFPLTAANAATLDVGAAVAIRKQGVLSDYSISTGLSGTVDNSFSSSASSYHAGVQSVRILAITPRDDGSGIVDVKLDTAPFTLPQETHARWAFQREDGTLVAFKYTASVGEVKYKLNPLWDGTNAGNYPIANDANANTLHGYETAGTNATWNSWQYVPDLAEYTGTSRCYMQQGYPRAGATDVLPRNRDGCPGRVQTSWHPYRIGGIEFGQGMWEVVTDVVICAESADGVTRNVMRMAPKGAPRQNTYAGIVANYVNGGLKHTAGGWPVEYDFTTLTGGQVNHGTDDAPAYVSCGIWPSAAPVYKPSGGEGTSYGDYHWAANSPGAAYEVLLFGNCGNGGCCGLLFLRGNCGLGVALWTLSARD